MNISRALWPGLVMTTVLSACTPEPGPEKPTPPPPLKDTAFGDMEGAVDKARRVEATTMQQKQDMDRALQEAESP